MKLPKVFIPPPKQMVSESMVVCGKGGEVFIVPTQWGQRKPKWSTHKDPGEKKKKKKEYC